YNIKGDRKLTKNLGQRLLYQKVKTSLGLDRVQEFICGGAPLMSSTQEFFLSLDIVIKPGYGLSECGCVSNFAPGEFKRDSCGSVFPSTEVRVVKSEEGIRGRGIMMGYLNDERAIEEAFDADGFLRLETWDRSTQTVFTTSQ
ncbi:AcylCoA synthetase bubblegum family member 2, partial [Caligus rogercresseyi]